MKSQREIYAESFADYVIESLKRTGIKQAELARRSKVSPQMISKIVRKEPHSLTGKLLLPERETVERIAKAFGDPVAMARRAAGYSEGNHNATVVDPIDEAIDNALHFHNPSGKLSDADRATVRAVLERSRNARAENHTAIAPFIRIFIDQLIDIRAELAEHRAQLRKILEEDQDRPS